MTSQRRNALWGLAQGPVISPGALDKAALHVSAVWPGQVTGIEPL